MLSLPIPERDMGTLSAPPALLSQKSASDRKVTIRNTFIDIDDESPVRAAYRKRVKRRGSAPAGLISIMADGVGDGAPWRLSDTAYNPEARCGESVSAGDTDDTSSEASMNDNNEADPVMPIPDVARPCGGTPACIVRAQPTLEKPKTPLSSQHVQQCSQEVVLQIPLHITDGSYSSLHMSNEVPVTLTHVRTAVENGRTVVSIQVVVGSGVPVPTSSFVPDIACDSGVPKDSSGGNGACVQDMRANEPAFVSLLRSDAPSAAASRTSSVSDNTRHSGAGVHADRRDRAPRLPPGIFSTSAFPGCNTAELAAPQSKLVCYHWRKKGWCKCPRSCRFQHPANQQGMGESAGGLGRR